VSRGIWMRTRSKGRFYPADPRPEDIEILDLASGIARECRYGGQMPGWFSVAEHSLLVASVLPPHLKLQGLMHDAPEGLIRDMTRPNKALLADYQALEDSVWRAVATKFGLPYELDPLVKVADDAVLLAERMQLFPDDRDDWSIKGEPANVIIKQLSYDVAEAEFLSYFHFLTKGIYQ
jgi:hypothetical protein